jgi:hypothetical protein
MANGSTGPDTICYIISTSNKISERPGSCLPSPIVHPPVAPVLRVEYQNVWVIEQVNERRGARVTLPTTQTMCHHDLFSRTYVFKTPLLLLIGVKDLQKCLVDLRLALESILKGDALQM